jgi:glucosyl-3-phosphoglycerate phosphatase
VVEEGRQGPLVPEEVAQQPSRRARNPDRTLVLLRHGQTSWNLERRAQGHSDVELDETGHAQAAAVAPYLAGLGPVLLWSSDLARARQTAEYVAKEAALEIRLDARLREFALGERTGLTMDEFAEAFPEEYREFRAGHYDVVPGGESRTQVVARVTGAVEEAIAALSPGECGVVVGHGGALKVSVLELLGWSEGAAAGLQALDNCGWAVIQDSGVDRRLRLAAWNRTAPDPPDFVSAPGVG